MNIVGQNKVCSDYFNLLINDAEKTIQTQKVVIRNLEDKRNKLNMNTNY